MTASKSSRARNARARNARAQASAARNGDRRGDRTGAKAGTEVKAGTGVNSGAPAKGGTGIKAGTGARTSTGAKASGAVNGGTAARTGAVRSGAPGRVGPRPQATQEQLAGASPAARTAVPLWMQLATFLLALAGLGVSVYLTIAHFEQAPLLGCSENGLVNCAKVTTSAQSYAFGIPVAVLGLAFYLFEAAVMSPWAWRSARREVHLARIASVIVGMGFVLYLLYAELFIIGSICLYCTSVHAITFVLFVLTMLAAAVWGLGPARQSG